MRQIYAAGKASLSTFLVHRSSCPEIELAKSEIENFSEDGTIKLLCGLGRRVRAAENTIT